MSKALSFRAPSSLLFFLALVVSNEGFYHVAAFDATRGNIIYSWSPSFVFDLYFFEQLPGQEQQPRQQTTTRDHSNGFHDGIWIHENIAIILVEFLCISSLPILWSFWKLKEISGTLLSLQSQIICMPKKKIVSSSTPRNLFRENSPSLPSLKLSVIESSNHFDCPGIVLVPGHRRHRRNNKDGDSIMSSLTTTATTSDSATGVVEDDLYFTESLHIGSDNTKSIIFNQQRRVEEKKLYCLIEDKKADIACKSFEVNILCQGKKADITSKCNAIEIYCQGKKADIDCKIDQVHVLCESKKSEITCKCDEVTTTICETKTTELKCKVNVIHDMCETKKCEIMECCDKLHNVCEKKKHGIIEKCCEVDDMVDCKKTDIKNKYHQLTVIVDCKKTYIMNKCCDLDAMLDCKITEMTSKARDLDIMLQRKMDVTLKKIEELDCLLTLKESQARGRYVSFDKFLNDKQTENQVKAEKIGFMVACWPRTAKRTSSV